MSDDEKPELRALLEHYDVRLRATPRQMVQCPLHTDKTPSCSVNFDKQVWSCKSCGKGGDSFSLIMEKEGVNFVGARAFAASLGLAAGSSGGSDSELSGSSYAGRRRVPARKGDRPSHSKYVPAWRRS